MLRCVALYPMVSVCQRCCGFGLIHVTLQAERKRKKRGSQRYPATENEGGQILISLRASQITLICKQGSQPDENTHHTVSKFPMPIRRRQMNRGGKKAKAFHFLITPVCSMPTAHELCKLISSPQIRSAIVLNRPL